eukprot:1343426-Amorphochlora_amoeboformis.AAC.2
MGGTSSKLPPLRTVKELDVPKLLGQWYVIGVIPTYFEKGAHNPVEKYTWDEKGKKIDVEFTFNANSLTGKKKSIPQKLYPTG